MQYQKGEIVYTVSGIYSRENAGRLNQYETIYIEARKVLKVGKYVTIGLDPQYTFNHRFISSDNECCDSYRLAQGQVKSKKSYEWHLLHFGSKEATHVVFKTREAAEQFVYDLYPDGIVYVYCDPFRFPKKNGEDRHAVWCKYGLSGEADPDTADLPPLNELRPY